MTHVSQVVRIALLMQITGLSRSSIYNRLNPKSPWHDPTFPQRVRLSSASRRGAVGWFLRDVEAWLASCQEVV